MPRREETHCPSCGHVLVKEEKIRYGGKDDSRSDPFLLCPACGRKRTCSIKEDLLYEYHL
ncbi:MAG: hypothetical protein ABFC24_10040 [Methanoregulaceae archaeon]